jgi:hypothetical protein
MIGLYKLFQSKVLGKYYAQQLSQNETGKLIFWWALYADEARFI